MDRIKILADSVKKKIAAGEVIEGPFSVIKELMENSLDAGATRIEVQVSEAGMRKIFVRDNGGGIPAGDIGLAVTEHATSKIQEIKDIEHIGTYGFRGEAISSISSVSRLTILSRSGEEDTGARLVSDETGTETHAYAGTIGTTVIVENLFYNIPARKKFLKSRGTELRYIRETFFRTALPNFRTEFVLDVDGKRTATLVPADNIGERIRQIYSLSTDDSLLFDILSDVKVKISGFFSRPEYTRTSRSMQHLYVNNRHIEYKYLGSLLSRSYESAMTRGEYPAAFIFIDIDPGLVDVNIHPAKREVKLFDQRYIDGLIVSLARKALSRQHKIAGRLFKEEKRAMFSGNGTEADVSPKMMFHERSGPLRFSGFSAPLSTAVKEMADAYPRTEDCRQGRILCVVFETYALVEKEGSLSFIDIHAAHERIIFDTLVEKKEPPESQELLFPKVLNLPLEDHRIIMENLGHFSEIGFQIEDFSDSAIVVRAVPEIAHSADTEKILADCIESLKNESPIGLRVYNRIAASLACHSARRAGEHIPMHELEHIVAGSLAEGRELRCPHGRPYVYTIEKNELERIFKRQ